jgi:DNA-binding transcriptional LysR family regulator
MVEEGEVNAPAHCAHLPLLHLMSRRNAWPAYFEQLGLDLAVAYQGDVFDQFSTLIGAAIAGLGAAIVPTYLVEAELAQGTLVAFGQPDAGDRMYYAVTPSGVSNPVAQGFCDWIAQEARRSTRSRYIAA